MEPLHVQIVDHLIGPVGLAMRQLSEDELPLLLVAIGLEAVPEPIVSIF